MAQGTYTPDPDATPTSFDPRDASFLLRDGVRLYGGFSGR